MVWPLLLHDLAWVYWGKYWTLFALELFFVGYVLEGVTSGSGGWFFCSACSYLGEGSAVIMSGLE